jgi:hypothetical protein
MPGRGSSGHDAASAELHVSSLVHVSPISRSCPYRLMWITTRTRRGSRLRDHASKPLRPQVAARPPRHRAASAYRHAHRSSRSDRARASARTVDLASRPLRRADEAAELARPPQTGGEVLLLQVRDAVRRRRVRPQEAVPGGDTERRVWAFVHVLFGDPERLRADLERMIEMERAESVNRWTGEYLNDMVLDARSSGRYPSADLCSLPKHTLHRKRPAQAFSSLAHRVQS